MDAQAFEKALESMGCRRVDRWHVDTGENTLVRPGAVSRTFEGQLAFLERRRAVIQSVLDESRKDRRPAGRSRRKERRRSRR